MVSIYANNNKIAYGIQHFILDTPDDLLELNEKKRFVGSTAFIVSTSQYYMLNSEKKWIEVNLFNCDSDNSSGDAGTEDSNDSYDGGDIEEDNIYDSGDIE